MSRVLQLQERSRWVVGSAVIVAAVALYVGYTTIRSHNVPSVSSAGERVDPVGAMYGDILHTGLCTGQGDIASATNSQAPPGQTDQILCLNGPEGELIVSIFNNATDAASYQPDASLVSRRGTFDNGTTWWWVAEAASPNGADAAAAALGG